jgi:hypothetical protein
VAAAVLLITPTVTWAVRATEVTEAPVEAAALAQGLTAVAGVLVEVAAVATAGLSFHMVATAGSAEVVEVLVAGESRQIPEVPESGVATLMEPTEEEAAVWEAPFSVADGRYLSKIVPSRTIT